MKLRKPILMLSALIMAAALCSCTTPAPTVESQTAKPTQAADQTQAPSSNPDATPAASSSSTTAGVTLGAFNGTTYTNDFLGMSFKIPDSWSVATSDQIAQALNIGADILKQDATGLSKEKVLYLAMALEKPYGTQGGFNANVNLVGTNLGLAGLAITSTKDMAQVSIDSLKQQLSGSSDVSITTSDVTSSQINGYEFAIVDATMTVSSKNLTVKQKYVFALKNNYWLQFTFSYGTDDELPALQSIIDSITVK